MPCARKTDLNWLTPPAGASSCYNGYGFANAPTGDWFFIEVNRHVNSGNFYQSQRAIGMTGGAAGQTWTRSQQAWSAGGGWSPWVKMLSVPVTAQAVGGSCVANTVAFDSNGALLSCQSGVWRQQLSAPNTLEVWSGVSPCRGATVATCPAGSRVVGGGVVFAGSCGCAESHRFVTSSRPFGNGWSASIECGFSHAVALCAQ